MNAFQFMSESPFLTFFLFSLLVNFIFKSWNRLIRHLNIRKHGWPPSHCDADGDFKEEEKQDDPSCP